ncbi:MAG TPA: transposase [Bacteroidia bacterium]|nr:transposase [Bacteroidia bacterium]
MTIVNWIDLFTREDYKLIITNNLKHCQQNKGLRVFEYVLMTNHIHMIVQSDGKPLSDTLRDFKSYSAKQLFTTIAENPKESRKEWLTRAFKREGRINPLNKAIQIWQNGNYPVLLFSKEMIQQKINYIHQNPVKAGFVAEPHEYLYSSASPDSPLKCCEW